ncbi:MAG: 13E12 repeat family protein [Actinomycetota bacterium]|nr:13E12 repeat family protein [Actinomycetota bacterium]
MSVVLDVEHDPDEVAALAATADIGTGVLTPVGVLDPARLSQHGRLDLLVAMERLKSWADAQQQHTLALLATHPAPVPTTSEAQSKQWVREEVACALRLSFGTAAARLHTATELTDRLPATLDALQRGELSPLHARILTDAVTDLDDPAATAVEARVLPRAASQTLAEFTRSVRRAVLAVDARGQDEKHHRAVEARKVELCPGEDGMASLWALLPAHGAAAIMATLNECAQQPVPADNDLTVDQRRADALVDLLTQTSSAPGHDTEPGGKGPAVQVSVALSTLLGLDDQPGELAGYGPIPAVLAPSPPTPPAPGAD